jgi:hypothetical protein
MIEKKPVGYVSGLPISNPQSIRSDANDAFKLPVYSESQLKAEVEMKDKIIKSLSDEVKSLELQLVKLLNEFKQSHEEPKV